MLKESIHVCIASIFSIIVLFALTKFMGKRQISQMSMFDYINGITIGSIAAEMATSERSEWLGFCMAMAVYAIFAVAISKATCKSIVLRKLFVGKAIVLCKDGKLYRSNLSKAKLDLNEFLEMARNSGYFDVDDIAFAVLEANGKVSFCPKDEVRPLTAQDMKITPHCTPCLVANVIMDGNVMLDNLEAMGKNETWLKNKLSENNINSEKEIFLATCDENDNFKFYFMNDDDFKDVWI